MKGVVGALKAAEAASVKVIWFVNLFFYFSLALLTSSKNHYESSEFVLEQILLKDC